MTRYLKDLLRPAPQSEPIRGREEDMVKNSAGGYTFAVDDFSRLRRFLVLGSENGSYYSGERELTVENAGAVRRCIEDDPERSLQQILDCTRIAPKNDQCLFALAMMAADRDPEVRKLVLADQQAFNSVVRIATHLFQFISYVNDMRGWGRSLRSAVGNWYLSKSPDEVAYQVLKYRRRHEWTHRDLFRKAHPKTAHSPANSAQAVDETDAARMNVVFNWVAKGTVRPEDAAADGSTSADTGVPLIEAYEEAKSAEISRLTELIREHDLSWEMVPTSKLKSPDVWAALLESMPINAMLRNLGRMTSIGTLGVFNPNNRLVTDRLSSDSVLQSDRLHPLSLLIALLAYRPGHGVRGNLKWEPVPDIVDALDQAFEKSFAHAPKSDKRFYLALDVSGSMTRPNLMNVPGLSPMVASVCLAMAISRREPNTYLAAFSHVMQKVRLTRRTSLWDAVRHVEEDFSFGATDCALPMLDAMEKGIPADCFVVFTDNETWYGNIHPAQALQQYRDKTGIPARLAVVAMTANEFSIADPDDGGMVDIAGFDASIPSLLHMFVGDGM